MRNNLKKHNIQIDENLINWKHIVDFYNIDSKLPIRMAPKLTQKHISLPPFTVMRVKYAVQILSHSVTAGIFAYASLDKLPMDAVHTADFIEKMDELFDILNSKLLREKKKARSAITSESYHMDGKITLFFRMDK